MARSLDTLMKETLGGQIVQIVALTAENEALKEQLAVAVARANTAELCAEKPDNKGSSTEEAGPT